MSGKTKFILIFIFPTFVADDRWFPNAAYIDGPMGHKGSAKFRFSEEKVNLFAFLSVRTYKNSKKECVTDRMGSKFI